ncbi:MAG: hypothetical protein PHU47_01150, partial [Candidatus ainarchaeum sp.]|nr:hypothetical protein [Candidatus ainarchaeum sp.]
MKAEKKINTNKESNKDKNIFSKIYGSLEKGYNNFSDWLTEKGIPINKLNQALEKKGIPPFALMGSILLLIIIIILFLIFGFSAKMELTTNFYDPNGVILNSVLFSIRDSDGIDVFTPKEPINNGQKLKVPLSLGKTYTVVATKEGYDMLSKSYTPTEKKDTITFNFYSQLQMGQLIVRPIDSYTNKVIPQVKGTIRYTDKGRSVENIVTSNGNSDLLFDAPLSTRLQITLEADGYQTTTFD